MKDCDIVIFHLPIANWYLSECSFYIDKGPSNRATQNDNDNWKMSNVFILHPSTESLLRLRRFLQIFNINLLHLHHRLHDSLRFLFVRILD